jgi:Fe-S-cluster containining protein
VTAIDRAAKRRLRMIYREIPLSPPCIPGCIDCCGPVPWSAEELARVEADIPLFVEWFEINGAPALLNPVTGKCPFASTERGCAVYERRPFMCRIFASAADLRLTCPHGCNAKRPLSILAAVKLTDRYREEEAAEAEARAA